MTHTHGHTSIYEIELPDGGNFWVGDQQYNIQKHHDRWMVHRMPSPIYTLHAQGDSWQISEVDGDESFTGDDWRELLLRHI